ncbi:calmodulin-lysine N-methyltransferase [Mercurialis annua]|uniref:calmodulin-lysine N-methyltransferase n=1 Tax=Mercurialis annua TaxID=3986 RepID=UPI002160497D|nr:calmodulin-lysine N-methyltransferase [Mercurialis annua]
MLSREELKIRVENMNKECEGKAACLRWAILRQALLPRHSSDDQSATATQRISRKTNHGFSLIPKHTVDKHQNSKDATVCYTLPINGSPKLFLTQRMDGGADLSDFEISNGYNVDNTGLVCQWPSEDILAYFCLSHADMFRSKTVIELGSGYGLAGLVIAATTEASQIVISDGNPQLVDYIQHNIEANSDAFGDTNVKSMMLHWDQDDTSNIQNTFDVIVASDCTFFKEFHKGLACTVKLLLKRAETSEALFFSPKRGDSLDKFLDEIEKIGLKFSVTENYNTEVWTQHQRFMNGDMSWPGYEKDHCYPLLLRVTL